MKKNMNKVLAITFSLLLVLSALPGALASGGLAPSGVAAEDASTSRIAPAGYEAVASAAEDALTSSINAANSNIAPAGYEAVASAAEDALTSSVPAEYIAAGQVLLIQDVLPWDFAANEKVLTSLGITYDKITSSQVAAKDLSMYKKVIIASDQTQSFYDTMALNMPKLETYVSNGGILEVHAADNGWNGGNWTKLLPGGVAHAAPANDANVIVDPAHPVVIGLTNADLSGWGSANHGYFTNLLPNTKIILQDSVTLGKPTLIEYSFGSGKVIASMNTLEWAVQNNLGKNGLLLYNLVQYLLSFVPPQPADIALVATTSVNNSVKKALTELGYTHTLFQTSDFTTIDFSKYGTVIIAADGGSISDASVAVLANLVKAGKKVIFLGGTSYQPFATGVNNYLLQIDTVNYGWKVSNTPHLTVMDANNPLAKGLPATYNFATSSAAYYMLRSKDPATGIAAKNGDGFASLFQKSIGSGNLIWFINSPYDGYWNIAQDYIVLKTILDNAIKFGPILPPCGKNVLFDEGHGNYWKTTAGYTEFTKALIANGYTVNVLSGPVTPAALANYSVFITNRPEGGYTATEISYIQDYIKKGGGVLLLGEYGAVYGNSYLNNISAPFGIKSDLNQVNHKVNYRVNTYWPIITNINPMLNAKSYIEYAGSSLSVSGSAKAVAWSDADAYITAIEAVEAEGKGASNIPSQETYQSPQFDITKIAGGLAGEVHVYSTELDIADLQALTGVKVLFDESHDEHNYLDPADPNNHDDAWSLTTWRNVLVSKGAVVDKLQAGPVDVAKLTPYDVFVIANPRNDFTLAEISAIQTYVSNGGGLLLITEGGTYGANTPAKIDAISDKFGISIDFKVSDGISNKILPHPVTANVSSVQWSYGNTLTSSGTAFPVIKTADNIEEFMSLNNYGSGKVAVISDSNIWADNMNGMNTLDNGKLAVNTIDWLAGAVVPAGYPMIAVSESGGRIAFVGDSNLFGDSDEDNNGISSFNELDNAKVALSLVNWLSACLQPGVPDISVFPPSISVTLPPNQETVKILNISNVGSTDLIYTIKDTAVGAFFFDDMEKGVNNWKADGLWHQSKNRYKSPATAWYYGIEGKWNYDTGAPNKGSLTSPLIDLTGATNAALTFWRWEKTEGGEFYDHRHVYISADNGATWKNIYISKGTDQGIWVKENIDISSYAGKKVLIRFEFDTKDAIANNFEGWYVDDVAVIGDGAIDWLSESPTAGTVPAGGTHLINVKINTTGLAPAVYNADIIIASNDPDEAIVNVPVNLQVTGVQVGTIVSIQDAAAPPGANVTVPIKITNVTNIGGADIWLSYDKNVVIVESIADGDLGSLAAANIDNMNGVTKMNWFSATGKTGSFVFAYVTLKAVGAAGQTGVLDLTVKEFVDANGMPIVHIVQDGKFVIGAALMEGDTNLNKHVTITDALLIAKYKAGLIVLTPDQLKAADTNDDGSVTMTDALFIAKWLADPNFPLWDPIKDSDMLKPAP